MRARSHVAGRTAAAAALIFVLAAGCIAVPHEAPQLSAELGERISAVEKSHIELVRLFIAERRRQVDAFITGKWAPEFTRETLADPEIKALWEQVSGQGTAEERLQFALQVGPRIQAKINARRIELIAPLDELQAAMEARLRDEYGQLKAINNAVTSFLASAADLAQARDSSLQKLGVDDSTIASALEQTDAIVTNLVGRGDQASHAVAEVKQFSDSITKLVADVKAASR